MYYITLNLLFNVVCDFVITFIFYVVSQCAQITCMIILCMLIFANKDYYYYYKWNDTQRINLSNLDAGATIYQYPKYIYICVI